MKQFPEFASSLFNNCITYFAGVDELRILYESRCNEIQKLKVIDDRNRDLRVQLDRANNIIQQKNVAIQELMDQFLVSKEDLLKSKNDITELELENLKLKSHRDMFYQNLQKNHFELGMDRCRLYIFIKSC